MRGAALPNLTRRPRLKNHITSKKMGKFNYAKFFLGQLINAGLSSIYEIHHFNPPSERAIYGLNETGNGSEARRALKMKLTFWY